MERLQQENKSLTDRLTEVERQMAKLTATTAPIERMTDVQTSMSDLSARVSTASREIEALRDKQAKDYEKSAEANKPDFKVVFAGGSLILSIFVVLASWIGSGQSSDKEERESMRQALLSEISEAKDAASSAGKKAGPVMDALEVFKVDTTNKIEDLQQRVPSESEWKKADSTIENLRQEKIRILQRLTESEGKIERSLLLITKEEEARIEENADILARVDDHSRDLLALNAGASKTNSAINGIVTEVEAQARGMMAVQNVTVAGLRQNLAMIWPRVFDGDSMPEIDYYNDAIPARANVSLGVNGD